MAAGVLRAFGSGLVEVFSLRNAERTVSEYGEERLEAIRAEKRLASADLRASRKHARPDAALLLLDRALVSAVKAARLANRVRASVATELEEVERARRERAALDFAEAETQRERIENLVHELLRDVESRSRTELAALRIGRMLAIVVAIVAIAWPRVRDRYLVHNVALHKKVTTSPLKHSPPTGEELVDGHRHGTFGVHTTGEHPMVMIDLERTYDVQRVRVYNRGDGWFDDVLPLTVSFSTDGQRWEDVGTRNDHFDVWELDAHGTPARYVRLTNNTYIAINAVEVYARN